MKHLATTLLLFSFLLTITSCSPGSFSSGMTFQDAGRTCKNATVTLKNHSDYDVPVTIDGLLYIVRPGKKLKKITPASISREDKKKVCVSGICNDIILVPCHEYDFSAETW